MVSSNLSSKAYEFGKGAKEIDGAINYSFDGISISPGVKITVKSGAGAVIYSGKGPYMAWADTYGAAGNSKILPQLKAMKADLPKWMVKYLENKSALDLKPFSPKPFTPADLSNAHYVKVEKIKNVPCE